MHSNTKQHLKPYSDTATFKSSWLTLKKKHRLSFFYTIEYPLIDMMF